MRFFGWRTRNAFYTACVLAAAAAYAATFVLVASFASARQPEWLSCAPQEQRVEADREASVVCKVEYLGDAPETYTLDAEILSGSVSDEDGTAAPPDATAANKASPFEVRFTFTSLLPGKDVVCIWRDADGADENVDEDGKCLDDKSTELIAVEWLPAVSPGSPGPTLPPSPSRDTSAAPEIEPSAGKTIEGSPTRRRIDGSPPRRLTEGSPPRRRTDGVGFVLVADPELSLAIDSLLVVAAGIVLWRWRWARAVVIESVRHPRTRSWIERDTAGVWTRGADNPGDGGS